MIISPELITRFNRPGPRYTSYPTAPEWAVLPPETYLSHLEQFGKSSKSLSLYIHIPFCAKMCYYCGCNVIIRKSHTSVGDSYLEYLEKELQLVYSHMGRKPLLKQLHLGGGTPNFLSSEQFRCLFALISNFFELDAEAEISVEIDPRTIHSEQLVTLKSLGVNRISMGIQDFDPEVQAAVNRIQTVSSITVLMTTLRKLKFDSINMDLIYGLPRQTDASFSNTVQEVIKLSPDRVALYSFAHVPWLKSHQSLIVTEELPESTEKLKIFVTARDLFLNSGYTAIGMDHFAKSSDEMSKAFLSGTLHRNFMGYTLKPADEFLGVGVSSISYISGGFFQNTKDLSTYTQALSEGQPAVDKGLVLTKDDIMRQWVIQELMCHFKLVKADFTTKFGEDFDAYFKFEQEHLKVCAADGLIQLFEDRLEVTELGRFFVRNVAMGFDWYLRQTKGHKRFSATV